MTPAEIAAECHRLEAKAAAKGYYMPKVTVRLNWLGYELTADIETRTDANARTVNKWVHIDYVDGFDNLFELFCVSHLIFPYLVGQRPVADRHLMRDNGPLGNRENASNAK